MISLIVPYLEIDDEKPALLKRFLDSVEGQYDELIIVDSKTDSYTKKVNDGLKKATGDYLIVGSDDVYITKGTLRDLPNETKVTFPLINDQPKSFGVLFCIPRNIYDKIGGFDEIYTIYCSDNDYLMTMQQNNVVYENNSSINFVHPEGGRTVHKIIGVNTQREIDKQNYIKKWGEAPKDM